jgi:hypothetical protein
MGRDAQGDALRAMLGEEGYARWQAYLPTRSIWVQADTYATALDQFGAPLTGAQLRGLVNVMLGEQQSLRQDMVALGRMVDENNPVSQAQATQALRNRQAQSNQRVLDAIASQLTTQQLTLLGARFGQGDAILQAKERTWERGDATTRER